MPSETSERNLENNVNGGWEVHGTPVLQRRLEANLLRSPDRRFVQSVPQTFRDALHFHLPGSQENDIHQNFSFDPKPARLVRIGRIRL